eukprot:627835_1
MHRNMSRKGLVTFTSIKTILKLSKHTSRIVMHRWVPKGKTNTVIWAHHFTSSQLNHHKWVTNNISKANTIILPLLLSMAQRGQCDGLHVPPTVSKKHFKTVTTHFFHHLNQNIANTTLRAKKFLLIAHDTLLCQWHNKEFGRLVANHKILLIVGHFEAQRQCMWRFWNTIVLPYTIPFEYDEYKEYDDVQYNLQTFDANKYDLMYMGSACMPAKFSPFAFKHRALALKYMQSLNQSTYFGVITDYNESQCITQGMDVNVIKACVDMEQMPCGLRERDRDVSIGRTSCIDML